MDIARTVRLKCDIFLASRRLTVDVLAEPIDRANTLTVAGVAVRQCRAANGSISAYSSEVSDHPGRWG